jgi:hypothetical protein
MLKVETAKAAVQRTGQGLTASNEGTPPSATIAIVFFILLRLLLLNVGLDNLLDIADLDKNVFGFQIGMDNATLAMEVIQTKHHLLGDLLHEGHGNPAVVPTLNQTQQVLSEDLENHADVDTIRALVFEGVEQTDDMLATGMGRVGLNDAIQQFDFIDGGFGVVGGGTNDFQRDVFAGGGIAR